MRIHAKKPTGVRYICPFCKSEIKASSKTEIYYRNNWIKGCNDCFSLSINEVTISSFQKKEY